MKQGQPVRSGVSVSGAQAGDSVTVTRVTLTYRGLQGTPYGPTSAAPSAVGVYSVTPSGASISVNPSRDTAAYVLSYVAGSLAILPADVVIKASPPKLAPPRSFTVAPFPEGSYHLTAKLLKRIHALALLIKRDKYRTVDLTGYTDNVFTPAFNAVLNQMRAAAVETRLGAELRRLHVSFVHISIVTGVSIELIASNTTAKGRSLNRRVVAALRAS